MIHKIANIYGFTLLVASLIIIVLLSYVFVSYSNIADDNCSWFHKVVYKHFAVTNDFINYRLAYPNGVNLFKLPTLLTYTLAKVGVGLEWFTVAMGLALIAGAYALSREAFKNDLVAGISSLLLVFNPAVSYWFRANMFGTYTIAPLGLFLAIVTSKYLDSKRNSWCLVGIVLAVLIWIFWSNAWITIVAYSTYLFYRIISRGIEFREVIYGAAILTVPPAIQVIVGLKYFTFPQLLSLMLLALAITAGSIDLVVLRRIALESLMSAAKLSLIAFSILSAIAISLIVDRAFALQAAGEFYSKSYRPIADYNVFAILAPASLVFLVNASRSMPRGGKYLLFSMLVGFFAAVISGYIDPSLSVYATALAAPMIALMLFKLATVFMRVSKRSLRRTLVALLAGLMALIVLAEGASSITIVRGKPGVFYGGLSRDLFAEEPGTSYVLDLLSLIEDDSLVVAEDSYAYWIVGYTNAYVVASPPSDNEQKALLASILVSDEYRATARLSSLAKELNASKAYLIVSEVVTVEQPLWGSAKVNLGRPIFALTATGATETYYAPTIDLAKLADHVVSAGYSLTEYFNLLNAPTPMQLPLAWSDKAFDSTLVKALVYAVQTNMSGLGSIFNTYYSNSPISVEEMTYMKLISVRRIPLISEQRDLTTYSTYLIVALYEIDIERYIELMRT
ncbi:MAG: hypothetical protein N3E36_01160 [Sulfolobales archaeon]|nr:hypothetical protein [Sulfolobales archaeon]MCX8198624.1 hypothetical protein [Sulfolobales archaeon]MDW8169698.1 hypothetical protein [Desulfurococcaceae archaeon]